MLFRSIKNSFEKLNATKIKQVVAKDAVAIIIGIEKYKRVAKADYAKADAQDFYDYAIRALGIKPENIKTIKVEENLKQFQTVFNLYNTFLTINNNGIKKDYIITESKRPLFDIFKIPTYVEKLANFLSNPTCNVLALNEDVVQPLIVALALIADVNVGELPAPIIETPFTLKSITILPAWSATNVQPVTVFAVGRYEYPA